MSVALKEMLDSVPSGWTLRKVQEEILAQIQQGMSEGKEFFFLNAPTGSGKSLINITMARALGSAYMLTPKKALQRQYMKDFSRLMVEVKGKSNYHCPDGKPCSSGRCVESEISPANFYKDNCRRCPWLEVLQSGENSSVTLFNFHSYLCQVKFANRFVTPRELMVIDESHNLTDFLRSFYDITISTENSVTNVLQMPNGFERIDEFLKWVKDRGVIARLEKLAKLRSKDDESNEYNMLLFKIKTVIGEPTNYLLGFDRGKYLIRRKFVGDLFQELSSLATIKIFSSATMFSPEHMCKYLSIPMEKVCYIEVPWPIPPEQGPVCLDLAAKEITYKSLCNEATPKFLGRQISEILEGIHPNDRGVIHCVSHKLKDAILRNLDIDALSRTTEDLDEYKKRRGAVLIGPAFYEGLDLHGDLCRFQILVKVPLPPVNDPLVKYFGYDHPETRHKVGLIMAQAYGRGIRSPEDFCTFYILDRMIYKWLDVFPGYMKKAILKA